MQRERDKQIKDKQGNNKDHTHMLKGKTPICRPPLNTRQPVLSSECEIWGSEKRKKKERSIRLIFKMLFLGLINKFNMLVICIL